MKLLCLDLGTKCGIAHNLSGQITASTLTLAKPAEVTAWGKQRLTRRKDPRVVKFFDYLRSFSRPDVVCFEDVEFSSYTLQVQMWASLRTCAWLAFPSDVTVIECVPVGTLKKFATGAGNADKNMMAKHLFLRYPEWKSAGLDDNGVDALWMYYWAQQTLGRGKYDR